MTSQVGQDYPAKPSVLIIGGLGYIGRFLALHIYRQNLASDVRLVDKILPQLAWLAPEFKECCGPDHFLQADASREASIDRVFDRPDGKAWDFVFNCGGETRNSEEDEIYRVRTVQSAVILGKEAAKRGVRCFVELSTGMVYKPESKPRKEADKLKPWTKLATWKLKAEEELSKIEGLNLVILRLAAVYGEYQAGYLETVLCMARVYQFLGKEFKCLWTKDLKMNTVHVSDAVRAIWTAAEWGSKSRPGWRAEWGKTATFNVVDRGQTTQGDIQSLIGEVFSIPTGYFGTMISTFARINLDHVVDDVNDETLDPWSELLKQAKITRPGPLSPFMEKELLRDNDMSLDGSRFEDCIGFRYEHPRLTAEDLRAMIASYKRMEAWP